MQCGDTFLLYDEKDADGKPHLHLVITEPDDNGQCVLVSVTTRRSKSYTMVCLDVGDHAFVKHASVITYAYSKLLTVAQLEAMVARGDATSKGKASPQLVARAQSVMKETDRAPREVQQFFKAIHRS